MSAPIQPRPTPCSSCPYRCGVPSGIWEASEYEKLERYDAPLPEQPIAVFLCHHSDGHACAGWLGHTDPSQLLAVRLGIARGDVDPDCLAYTTSVPLFPSGAAAAAHGLAEIAGPGERAVAAIDKLEHLRTLQERRREAC
jgi:hypothetical protein